MYEDDWDIARAALEWQIEMGVSDAIGDLPIDRYAEPTETTQVDSNLPKSSETNISEEIDPIVLAEQTANSAKTLIELRQAIKNFPHCDLQFGARNLVFGDGIADAPVMILSDVPGREEDAKAKPFVGAEGLLLDKMLAAIGLSRQENTYIATVVPWRPPQDRDPKKNEIDMMTPFIRRHVSIVQPKVLICIGKTSCISVLGKEEVNNIRGQWHEGFKLPVMPMLHPRLLLRQPLRKKEAWRDLLEFKSWLRKNQIVDL